MLNTYVSRFLCLTLSGCFLSCSEEKQEVPSSSPVSGTESEAVTTDDSTEDTTTATATNTETDTETDTEPVEPDICDGIDNDGDGRIDEGIFGMIFYPFNRSQGYEWFDAESSGIKLRTMPGVRYVEKWQDGYIDFRINQEENEIEAFVVPADEETDQFSASHYDTNAEKTVVALDKDNDGFAESVGQWMRDASADNNYTEFNRFSNTSLIEVTHLTWSYQNLTEQYEYDSIYTYTKGMEPESAFEIKWIDDTRYEEGMFYLTAEESGVEGGQAYFSRTTEHQFVEGVLHSSWKTDVMEDYFGVDQGRVGEQLYTEYAIDEADRLYQIETWWTQDLWGEYPIDPNEADWLAVYAYNDQGQLLYYRESNPGFLLYMVRITWEDGLPVHTQKDLDGDGNWDVELTMEYQGEKMVRMLRNIINPEEYDALSALESIYHYDENDNLVRLESDYDGDGIADIIIDYVISCDPQQFEFDANNYDYDGDDFSPANGDCDDSNKEVFPGQGCPD